MPFPSLRELPHWFFGSDRTWKPTRLLPRWLFLRALGLIFFSAFYSLFFQVRGLIGPEGLQPAGEYLLAVKQYIGVLRYWYVPTLLWLDSGSRALVLLCVVGMAASLLLVLNLWPRAMIAVCLIVFVSFISTLQAFSSYQSDDMLLAAGFLSLFFAPPGLRPGLGEAHPPSRASLFLLLWEWFRIYFESGVAKIASGDPEWRHFTAMNEYYQNGPLPTWIAWYAQHLPLWFQAATTGLTLLLELLLVWGLFLPRRFRIVLFWIVTPWQIGIILTSNYAFLNYLVLSLGILLLDDDYLRSLLQWLPLRVRKIFSAGATEPAESAPAVPEAELPKGKWARILQVLAGVRLRLVGVILIWIFYATTALLVGAIIPSFPLPTSPVTALEPFRIANQYGLFAVMTRGRYEIEFQGSNDGKTWTPYPFRYKPQDPRQPPRIYAPYQPRFDWNLWFASLDNWQQNRWVVTAEERLLTNSPSVLALFAGNPFPGGPPKQVRAVIWQYWFTGWAGKRKGFWWRRQLLGLYAPELEREPDGRFLILDLPQSGAGIRR
jgi:Lipase maturation factor